MEYCFFQGRGKDIAISLAFNFYIDIKRQCVELKYNYSLSREELYQNYS